jgi:hypothetical protein
MPPTSRSSELAPIKRQVLKKGGNIESPIRGIPSTKRCPIRVGSQAVAAGCWAMLVNFG